MLHVIYLKFLCQTKSITHRWIPILQVANKISTRLTPKLFKSLSKVYMNQGGVDWFFIVNEVNLLFYIIRRKLHIKYRRKTALPNIVCQRNEKQKTLILLEVRSILMIWIFDNTENALWRSCWKYISLDFICLPFLDFLCHLKYRVKQHLTKSMKSFM